MIADKYFYKKTGYEFMNAYFNYLNELMNKHKVTYSAYPELQWLNPYEAAIYQDKRDELLASFNDSALFKGTKPFYKGLSQGCQRCGEGLWSCLFIASKCNANCFYCPTAQNSSAMPESQGLTFETAEAYAEYVQHFKFKGVGFSGGEPLLEADKVIAYTKQLRRSCDSDLYIWMYTNGILASEEIFSQLGEAGINEVRFDIGATHFKLDAIAKARDHIQNLTIEIPAVPEETELLKKLLPKMVDAGVTNLNLHQMRLTPYNVKKLIKHNYTYVAAEQPIVLESELAALEIMNYAKENNLSIGINYCSFFFKSRFQKAGFRKMMAQILGPKEALITENGYIRNKLTNALIYEGISLGNQGDLMGVFSSLNLQHKSYDYQNIDALRLNLTEQSDEKLSLIEPGKFPEDPSEFNIWRHEYIENGLREY
jgi:pyruvate formate-lyase activating enzyme-like uncharacterized protein